MTDPQILPSWDTTTLKPEEKKETALTKTINKGKEILHWTESKLPTFVRKYVDVAPWEEPNFRVYDNCKKPNNQGSYCKTENGKIIRSGNQMINFKRKKKRNDNNTLNFESRKKRYHRSKNYNPNAKKIVYTRKNGSIREEIPVNSTSLIFYTAKAPKLQGNKLLNRRHFKRMNETRKAMSKPGFSFEDYQTKLKSNNPAVRDAAVKELRILQEMLKDARKMDRKELEKKYNRLTSIKTIASLLGMGLGMGIGSSTNVAFAVGKVGSVLGLLALAKRAHIRHASNVAAPIFTLGEKAIIVALLATLVNLSNPGISIAISAVVASTVAVGATLYGKHLEFQKLTTEMNGDNILKTIDNLIKENGILTLEDNPLFAKARGMKEELEQAIDDNQDIEEFITTKYKEQKNQNNARIMYADMTWAKDIKQKIKDAVNQGKDIEQYIKTEIPEKDRNYASNVYLTMQAAAS